jgi:type I restriction enzyme S subunit
VETVMSRVQAFEQAPLVPKSSMPATSSWLPQLPEHWILSRVKNHFTFPKNVAGENFLDYKVLSLSIYGVIIRDMDSGKGKFSLSMDTYQVVNPNSIILCLFDMDVTPRIVGYCNDLGIITSAYTIILPKENVCAKYYYYYFLSQDHNKSLFSQGTGVRTTLTNFQFGSLPLPLPPLEEQTTIANYLDEKCNSISTLLEKKKQLIDKYREKINVIVQTSTEKNSPEAKQKEEKIKREGTINKA